MLLEDDNPILSSRASSAVHKNLDPLSPEGALDDMSLVELEDYVAALQAEIKRAEAEIAKKSSSRAAAEAVFGKG